MTGDSSLACLESFVGEVVEAESAGVEGCGLLGVSNPEGYVVYDNIRLVTKSEYLAIRWALLFFSVVHVVV